MHAIQVIGDDVMAAGGSDRITVRAVVDLYAIERIAQGHLARYVGADEVAGNRVLRGSHVRRPRPGPCDMDAVAAIAGDDICVPTGAVADGGLICAAIDQ